MDKQVALGILIISALLLGCGASTSAPRTPRGQQIEIRVLFDSGTPGRAVVRGQIPSEASEEERRELITWMERDLISVLNHRGYAASTLKSLEEYNPGPQTCRLSIALESYVPADRTSRLEAGMGEGSATVDVLYELFVGRGGEERRLFSNQRNRTSARNWERIVGELNKEIAADVTKRLSRAMK